MSAQFITPVLVAKSPKFTKPAGPISISSGLEAFWEFSHESMDADALAWFFQASEEAESMACRLANVTDGIACLVASDDGAGTKTGIFQTADTTSNLLVSISQSLRSVQGLIWLGSNASFQLRKREQKGAK